MNRYTVRGKPAASPLKPSLMWLGRKGSKDSSPRCSSSVATETTASTSISAPKK
jgi:hypothetical protein